MNRHDCVSMLYERIKDRAGCTLSEYEKAIENWDILKADAGGKLAAIGITKGPEFHVVAIQPGKWASRRLFSETLGKAIRNYGYAETSVMKGNAEGEKFVQRIGFVKVGENGMTTIYRLEKVKHA